MTRLPMTRLLLTGHLGFVGGHLRALLARPPWRESIDVVVANEGFDIRDERAVHSLVERARPDWVLHLAAQSHIPTSISDPVGTFAVNLIGTTHLLAALDAIGFAGRLLYVSSADIYGRVGERDLPITEELWPRPANPYAVSKAAAEMMCLQWHERTGRDVVVARPFNHVGAGQRPEFALASFARAIAAIRLGRAEPVLRIGNLEVSRDFGHVLDLCEGLLALLERGRPGATYNLCSGVESPLRSVLEGMLSRAGCEARIEVDPALVRKLDQPRVLGSYARATADTGWRPARTLGQALDEMVAAWEREIAGEPPGDETGGSASGPPVGTPNRSNNRSNN